MNCLDCGLPMSEEDIEDNGTLCELCHFEDFSDYIVEVRKMNEKVIEIAQEFGDWQGEVNHFGLAFVDVDYDDKHYVVTQDHDGFIAVEKFFSESDRDYRIHVLETQYDYFRVDNPDVI